MINIAIDGPAGAGKTTAAKLVAEQLNFVYVDTGALYRALAYGMRQNGIEIGDTERVISELDNIKLELRHADNEQTVILNDENVTGFLRTPEIARDASDISAIPEVRDRLMDIQRDIAMHNNVVMEGRDIGTVILPDADVKIYLTALDTERARRRYVQLTGTGEKVNYDDILTAIRARDYNDSHRETSPLTKADGAILLDSTHVTIADIVDTIVGMVKNL